ncbi:uncharacterized protein COLE_06726 [Cutaneotrichosporon oleaginosum]|uniref:uncharacterized protein n=1 Tax=Cutaneotrichosporon oleaginosum TaxID=879819 RepID=UPI00132B5485|nr:hypothetical protein COLE_06726 [Cutaneotrichosporon oleaginosum]
MVLLPLRATVTNGLAAAPGDSTACPIIPALARGSAAVSNLDTPNEVQLADERWTNWFFRPSRATVETWLASFWKRHLVLTLLPCLAVWLWVAMPFPVSDPYKDSPLPDWPEWPEWPHRIKSNGTEGGDEEDLPIDVNFYFFLIWCVTAYLAVALFFITNLFSLYRLNWWPSRLGGKATYFLMWSTTLAIGLLAHHLDLFGLHARWRDKPDEGFDWERKTFWVVLSFAAMHLPAVACFSKLKRDKRHVYRHAQPVVQYTFFGSSLRRVPSSWVRFLWFMACLAIAAFSLIVGQGETAVASTRAHHHSVRKPVPLHAPSHFIRRRHLGVVMGDQYVSAQSLWATLTCNSRPAALLNIQLHHRLKSALTGPPFCVQALFPTGIPCVLS